MVEEKYVLKKRRRNMGNTTQTEKLEQHGTKPSVNSKKKSTVKLGKCPNPKCGRIHVRFDTSITHAVCMCKNPAVLVPLPVMITRERYEDGKRLAKEMEADGDGDRKRLLQGLLNDVFEVEMVE